MEIAKRYAPLYTGEYTEEVSNITNALSSAKNQPVGFKAATLTLSTEGSSSVNDPSTIYFTPEGIMMGGYMIAQPTPFDLIDEMVDTIANTSGALQYVGVIGECSVVDKPGTQLSGFISALYPQKVYAYGTNAVTEQQVYVNAELQSATTWLDLEPFAANIYIDSLSQAYSNRQYMIVADTYPDVEVQLVKITNIGTQQLAYNAPSVKAYTMTTKTILLPYTLTAQDVTDFIEGYAPNDNKTFLYLPTAGGNSQEPTSGAGIITNNTFKLVRGVKFEDVTKITDVHAGYTFMVQDSCRLISDDSSTNVSTGDMVIVANDILYNSENPQGLSASDFTIIRGQQTRMASRRVNGLMSSDMYAVVEALDNTLVDDNGDLIPATYNRLGVVSVGKNNSKTQGLLVDGNGALSLSLGATFTDLLNQGIEFKLWDTNSSTNITKSTRSIVPVIPAASSGSFGVVKVDGDTITINNGVISSAARLTWS